MKRLSLSAVLLTMGLFAEAHAVGRLADVSVIDRDSGCALATHYYRGEYWVAGSPGARYAIEIRNRLGERVLAVTSVDGINVVSGATAGWGQTGYVFGAGENYQITGVAQKRFGRCSIRLYTVAQLLRGAHRTAGKCGDNRRCPVSRALGGSCARDFPPWRSRARGEFGSSDRRGRQRKPRSGAANGSRRGQLCEKLRQHCAKTR